MRGRDAAAVVWIRPQIGQRAVLDLAAAGLGSQQRTDPVGLALLLLPKLRHAQRKGEIVFQTLHGLRAIARPLPWLF